MSLAHIPLPSIALVLTSNRVSPPTRPSVIKFDFDPLQTIYPTNSAHQRVSNPNDTHIRQHDPVPLSEVDKGVLPGDTATNLEGDDASHTPTAFTSKGAPTSHDFPSKENMKFGFMTLANSIRKLLRFRTKDCTSPIGRNVAKVDVAE